MKKLLIITSDYYHPLRHRLHNIIKPINEVFDVHIIALLPDFKIGSFEKDEKENFNKKFEQAYKSQGNITTIKVNRIPTATFLLTYYTIKKVAKKQKYDACLVIGPYFGLATFLAKLNCPVIYEDTDRFEYFSKNKLSKHVNRSIERYCIRKATHVISVGYSLAENAKEIQGDNRISCIPNGVDYKLFSEIDSNTAKNVMVYVGTISDWSGLDLVIKSMPAIKKEVPDIKLVIIGEGEYLNNLKERSKEIGGNKYIEFLGKKEYTTIPKILSECKIGLAVYPKNNLMKYAFTLKLIEYMAAGLPVITTDIGDGAQIIKESNSGFIVDYTIESFSNAVIRLVKDDKIRNSMSKNGTRYAKKFDWSNLASLEIAVLNNNIDYRL